MKLGFAGKAAVDRKKLGVMESNLQSERRRLEDQGYSFATRPDGGIFVFDPYGHKADPKAPEFAAFTKMNAEVADLSLKVNPPPEKKRDDDIYGPENGRGGKTATNPTNLEQKFLNLSKNAGEAEKGGLPFALRDETVYSRLEKSGVSEGAGVSEGLMKESGFEEFEIRSYREGKMKGSNEAEREVLKKMEVASEKIAGEYDRAQKIIYERLKKGATDKEALAEYKGVELTRMLNLIFK